VVAPFKSSAHGSSSDGYRELAAVLYSQNRVGSASGPRRMQVVLPNVEEVTVPEEVSASYFGSNQPFSPTSSAAAHSTRSLESASDIESESDSDDAQPSKRYVTKVYRPKSKTDRMISLLRKGPEAVKNKGQLTFAHNKEPYWLESIQAYSLDFQGRVTQPSNKNFQLELDNVHRSIAMQFGKVVAAAEMFPTAVYTVDVEWPLSPLQAFGICLSSCDRKLAVA